MNQVKEINAHIGEVKIAKNGETLKAILGSCVGIGLICRKKNIVGLAHCLLPESFHPSFAIGGRFVDQAIPSLLLLMKLKVDDYPHIEAVLAGGANMTRSSPTPHERLIGDANAELAVKILKTLGIRVIYQDLGGDEGRRIVINGTDFSHEIKKIPRIAQAS
jgi:chemotaxis protein CheD